VQSPVDKHFGVWTMYSHKCSHCLNYGIRKGIWPELVTHCHRTLSPITSRHR